MVITHALPSGQCVKRRFCNSKRRTNGAVVTSPQHLGITLVIASASNLSTLDSGHVKFEAHANSRRCAGKNRKPLCRWTLLHGRRFSRLVSGLFPGFHRASTSGVERLLAGGVAL